MALMLLFFCNSFFSTYLQLLWRDRFLCHEASCVGILPIAISPFLMVREEIMNVYIYRDMKRERESIVHTCTIYMNVYLLSFQKKGLFWARALTFIIILLSCANPICIPRYLSQVILTVKWH